MDVFPGSTSRDMSASRLFESLEQLQESSSESEDDEFYDARGNPSFMYSYFPQGTVKLEIINNNCLTKINFLISDLVITFKNQFCLMNIF